MQIPAIKPMLKFSSDKKNYVNCTRLKVDAPPEHEVIFTDNTTIFPRHIPLDEWGIAHEARPDINYKMYAEGFPVNVDPRELSQEDKMNVLLTSDFFAEGTNRSLGIDHQSIIIDSFCNEAKRKFAKEVEKRSK